MNAHATIAEPQSVEQLAPPSWDEARAAYLAAKAAEHDYDRDFYMPAFRRWNAAYDQHGRDNIPALDRIPDEIDTEMDRLQNIRYAAEGVLMDIPSPDAVAFAQKFLVARGEGRGFDGWDEMLEVEARRFATPSPTLLDTLCERDRLLGVVNTTHGMSDDDAQSFMDQAIVLEDKISTTPAAGREDMLAKLLIAIGYASLPGFDVRKWAEQLFAEAKALNLIEHMA